MCGTRERDDSGHDFFVENDDSGGIRMAKGSSCEENRPNSEISREIREININVCYWQISRWGAFDDRTDCNVTIILYGKWHNVIQELTRAIFHVV